MNVDSTSIPTPSLEQAPTPGERLARKPEFAEAYGAQLAWSQLPVKERLARINGVRGLIVAHRYELTQAIELPNRQGYVETLTTEILPLADALQWLHKRARRILAPRYCNSWLTPLWLGSLRSTVFRAPHGLVFIIGASNYPLFLTGVQLFHALAAGNAVALKPAPGAERVTELLVKLAEEAGIPEGLIKILDSSVEAAKGAIEAGVDKVVVTGSSRTGRRVLRQLSESLTPATLELSGCDAVYVLPGADLNRVCDVLLFGMKLNGGATCMAPRRVFVTRKASEVFHRLLRQELQNPSQANWKTPVPNVVLQKVVDGIQDAVIHGARLLDTTLPKKSEHQISDGNQDLDEEGWTNVGHIVLTDASPAMKLCSADIFAPLIMIIPVEDWAEALQADSQCTYALSASIYGPLEDALRLTKYISAGTITINDTIVPTANPQLPFGGRGNSGYGVTRGDEGLLEMTVPKVVTVRKGNWLPHSKPLTKADEELLDGILQVTHAHGWAKRWQGIRQALNAVLAKRKLG